MSDEQESSVLFSLQELMSIEEDRIKTEEEEKQAAAEAAERARLEEERRARDAEEARLRAEEERKRQEEARAREEATRLEAIRQGEMEKARAEAEQRARMEAMAAQQAHEQQLAVLQQDQGKKRLKNMLFGGLALFLVVGGAGGYFAYDYSQKKEQERVAAEAKAATEKAAREQKEQELNKKLEEITALQDKLNSAANPEEIQALKDQLARAKAEADDISKAGPGGRPVSRPPTKEGPAKPPPPPACDPKDPLCGSL